MGVLINGDRIEFLGGVFENIGNKVGPRGNNEFTIYGNDAVFKDCQIIIRGSLPYGYGDLYGKGRGAFVKLQKHAAMSVMGDRLLINETPHPVHLTEYTSYNTVTTTGKVKDRGNHNEKKKPESAP